MEVLMREMDVETDRKLDREIGKKIVAQDNEGD